MDKKIIFWIDGVITQFGLAHYLQKKNNYNFYAIIDIYNKPKKFHQEQKFVNFEKVWYYNDEIQIEKSCDYRYLATFEEKYQINLWELAINERNFYRFNRFYKFSSKEILSILEQECRLFENILDEIKPDFFITKEPPLHHHELFYRLCRAKGVKVLMLNQPNLSKCIISEEAKKIDKIENMQSISIKNLSFEQLLEHRRSLSMFNKIKYYRENLLNSKINLLKAAVTVIFSKNHKTKNSYFSFGHTKIRLIVDTLIILLKKIMRKRFIDKNLLLKVDLNEKFVYFPLGVNEERNLLILASFYTNQVEVIRHIVKSLPIGYKLYVKENPAEVVRRWKSISEYKEMLSIPNVYLVHPDFSTEDLYKNSSLVISISGSSGLEAAFYGKPSIVFSDVGYSILPSVYRVTSPEILPDIIRQGLRTIVNANDVEKYLIFFDENSFNFDIHNFEIDYQNYFYFGGNLGNTEISNSRMTSFLEKHRKILEDLADEYIKKLNA